MRPSGPDIEVPENELPGGPSGPGDSVTPVSGKLPALFPILGVAGWLVLAGLLAVQWYLTSPGRRGPTL